MGLGPDGFSQIVDPDNFKQIVDPNEFSQKTMIVEYINLYLAKFKINLCIIYIFSIFMSLSLIFYFGKITTIFNILFCGLNSIVILYYFVKIC